MFLGKRKNKNIKEWVLLLAVPALFMQKVALADEGHLYDFLWLDPDKKVYVLQNKVYKKEKTFYANLGYVKGLSNEYQSTSGVHASTGYYFNEEWAMELFYNSYNNSDNDAMENLRKINGAVPFVRKTNSLYGGMAVWSPFYGKINTFNKIIYFDWSFGAGIGQIQTESNALTVAESSTADTFRDEKYLAIPAKTALRVHITKKVHLGIEYWRTSYRAPGPKLPNRGQTDKWRANSDIIIGIGFSF